MSARLRARESRIGAELGRFKTMRARQISHARTTGMKATLKAELKPGQEEHTAHLSS